MTSESFTPTCRGHARRLQILRRHLLTQLTIESDCRAHVSESFRNAERAGEEIANSEKSARFSTDCRQLVTVELTSENFPATQRADDEIG